MLGTNDAATGRDVAAYRADLEKAIDLMLGRGVVPILSTIPPHPVREPLARSYNEGLRSPARSSVVIFAYSFVGLICSNSMRSNRAAPPIAVGAMPVSVKSPKSPHRSRVTTVHSRGAEGEISTDCQPVVLRPAW
jgi:hypothetical protein